MNQVQQPRLTMKPAAPKTCCCGPAANNPDATNDATTPSAPGQTHDPVCGMVVDPVTAKHRTEYDAQPYYFCCSGCKAKFLADPVQFVYPTAQPAPRDRKSTRLNSSHLGISYAVFC